MERRSGPTHLNRDADHRLRARAQPLEVARLQVCLVEHEHGRSGARFPEARALRAATRMCLVHAAHLTLLRVVGGYLRKGSLNRVA